MTSNEGGIATERRWFVNATNLEAYFQACDGPRIAVAPGGQATADVPVSCGSVRAEQLGALYEAAFNRQKAKGGTKVHSLVTGGTPEFPLLWTERDVVCFDNQASRDALLQLTGDQAAEVRGSVAAGAGPVIGGDDRLTVPSRGSRPMDEHKVCYGGLTVDAIYKGVSPTNGDVRGRVKVKESGVWVTSSQLRYDILS